jgi:hypothetical protein
LAFGFLVQVQAQVQVQVQAHARVGSWGVGSEGGKVPKVVEWSGVEWSGTGCEVGTSVFLRQEMIHIGGHKPAKPSQAKSNAQVLV